MAPERPSPYRSRYLLYKKGSQQVVTWLYETASALDTHSKSLDQLCVDDLPSLAQTISNAKIELPKSIASTLSDVIYLRQQAHEWYSSLARDNAAADDDRIGDINKSHRYFIEKLKGVRATLDPTGAKAAKHDSSQQQQETPPSDISNIFASLELEEPTDAPLGDEAESDAFDQAADVFAGKLEDTRRFKIWCMLKDVQDIRAHVRLLWRRYYDGEITFPVAAHLTDTAFRAVTDIVLAVEDTSLREYANIVQVLDLRIEQDSETIGGISGFSSTIDKDANGLEAADLFCVAGWRILQDLLWSMQVDRGLRASRQDNSYFHGHPLGPALRDLRDQLRLLSQAADQSGHVGPLRLDHFTFGLLFMCWYGYVHTTAVIQCQMYMDIYDALGRQPSTVTSTVRSLAASVPKSLNEYVRAFKGRPSYQKYITEQSDDLLALANVSLGDRFPGEGVPEACKPSAYFAALPVFAGTYVYDVSMRTTSLSIQCTNGSFATLGAAYLYSASEDMPIWNDMAALLEQHKQYVPHESSLGKRIRNFERAVGAKQTTRRRPAGKDFPTSVADAQTSLSLPSYVKAVRQSSQKFREGQTTNLSAGILYETVRLHRGKRFVCRSAVDLLSAFSKVVIDEEGITSIDYFRMSVRCKNLMDSIIKDFRSRLQDLLETNTTGPTYQNVVHAILREASDIARAQSSNAQSATSITILDLLRTHFEHAASLTEEDSATKPVSGNIADEDKPCNRWTWGGDGQPGYIKGKKVFGPETPWDWLQRVTVAETRAIAKVALDRYDTELRKKGCKVSLGLRLDDVERWMQEELFNAGLTVAVRRIDSSETDGYYGFETTWYDLIYLWVKY